jgi:DNA-binding CsgD family transcriptional regulator
MNNTLPPTAHQDFLNLARATDETTLKSLLALKSSIQELKTKAAEILDKCYKIRQVMEADPNMEGYLTTTDTVVRLGGNLEWIDGLLVINLSDIDEAEDDFKASSKLEVTLAELSSSMASLGWVIIEELPGLISKQTYKHPDLQLPLIFTLWMRDSHIHKVNINTGEGIEEPLATGVKPAEALELVKESINCCIVEKGIDRLDRDIIKLVWRDYSNAQIATELSLSLTGVTARIKSIKLKLQLKSRQDIKNYYTANPT